MLTEPGISTWNIENLAGGSAGPGYSRTFRDIALGVDHLRSLAKRYPLDLKRGGVVGHSAGAHLALFAASRPRVQGKLGKGASQPAAIAAIDP
jgi:acetyl esterase/lipase